MHYIGNAHWFLPWLILLIGMYDVVRFARGYINETTFTKTDQRLVAVFSSLMDLQAALGLIFFLTTGLEGIGFPSNRILHGTIMFVAAVAPHLSSRWVGADDQSRYLNNFFGILGSFLLMLVGLSAI
ncbi:MAG: hypothetical protein QM730_09390 [Anaerolineales bacterium]